MSSTSIARQNRRMRIRQNISALDLETKQANMPIKLNPSEKIINASVLNTLCNKSNYVPKSSYEIEPDSYSTLSYAASCDFLNGNILSQPVEKIFIEGDSKWNMFIFLNFLKKSIFLHIIIYIINF